MSQYNINNISPTQRDYLLNLNLAFSKSVTNYTSYANGIGYPLSFSTDYAVKENKGLLVIGNEARPSHTSQNKYQMSSYVLTNINYTPNVTSTINGGYYINGAINGVDRKDDYKPNPYGFSLPTSTSLIQELLKSNPVDTPRGVLANENLKKAFEYRLKQNAWNTTLGRVNTNIYSLLNGDGLVKRDYHITNDTGIYLFDELISITGFENPFKGISSSATPIDNAVNSSQMSLNQSLSRNDILIKETGKGQLNALKYNLSQNLNASRNGYVPNYTFGKKQFGKNLVIEGNRKRDDVYDDAYLTYSGGVVDALDKTSVMSNYNSIKPLYDVSSKDSINSITDNKNETKQGERFISSEPSATPKITGERNTIINKTLELLNTNVIKTPLNNKGTTSFEGGDLFSVPTKKFKGFNGGAISKGSQFVYLEKIDGKNVTSDTNEYFCRSWVHRHSYDKVKSMQKHRGLDTGIGRRLSVESSILDDNGFVKITPYINEDKNAVKKYMFSLENLAWSNNLINLPDSEIGNGDPITGTKGRIMWFPPYNLTFSESSSVNLDTHTFIGRGEPIYTYNNTERTASISFSVIVDNPAQFNGDVLRNQFNEEDYEAAILAMTAGCGDNNFLDEGFSTLEKESIKALEDREARIMDIANQTPPEPIRFYFPNDVATFKSPEFETYDDVEKAKAIYTNPAKPTKFVDEYYEVFGSESRPVSTSWVVSPTGGYTPGKTTNTNGTYLDRKNFGLNSWISDIDFLNELRRKLVEDCPTCKVYISGFASTDGHNSANNKLSTDRAKSIAKFFVDDILREDTISQELRFGSNDETVIGKGETGVEDKTDEDHLNKKKSRVVVVTFKPDVTIADELINQEANKSLPQVNEYKRQLKYRLYDEANYFKKLSQEDPLSMAKISQKIQYFNPAFHSITPEGFNSRLTFLQQCTRQGSTPTSNSSKPNNMAFGMPPVCILRLGDFFNTKVLIDSLSIDYEQMWDLNPEGIGVQPMIANVSLNFKIIGGASMDGPIAKLQNAVSFNYYANTQIYDPRADYIVKKEGVNAISNGMSNLSDWYNENSEIDSSFESENQNESVLSQATSATETTPELDTSGVISDSSKSVKTLYLEEGSPYYMVEMYSGNTYFIMASETKQNEIIALNGDNIGRMGVLQSILTSGSVKKISSTENGAIFSNVKTLTVKNDVLIEFTDLKSSKVWVNDFIALNEKNSNWSYFAKVKFTNLKNGL